MTAIPLSSEFSDEMDLSCHSSHTVERWRSGTLVDAIDQVAEEIPVAMVYNGISHVVMLATPSRLEQFGLGFSLSEGILRNCSELYDMEILPRKEGIELQMTIDQERFVELKQRRRNLAGRTGCGLCGTESLQQVQRHPAKVKSDRRFSPDAIHRALSSLPDMQSLQAVTGAAHAAAWVNADGVITHLAEDIGRHNALDKLIGTQAMLGGGFADGFAIVTSRASYEMVQKSAAVGIPMLVAVSAPTSLAVELAQDSSLTLVGFARGSGHVIYSHSQRLIDSQVQQ